MASYKFKLVTSDLTMVTPVKESLYYTQVQVQVLINQMITKGTYIKHRVTPVGDKYLNYEILVKPEE
jgi:hypothetical protein